VAEEALGPCMLDSNKVVMLIGNKIGLRHLCSVTVEDAPSFVENEGLFFI
jgi:hypothetical protein